MLTIQADQEGFKSQVLVLHKQLHKHRNGTSCKCEVQVLHMQTQGGPNPAEGQEPQLGWMALYPESRYMLIPL